MKKTLVMLALVASGLAFADAPASAQPQQKPQTPASQPAKAAPAKPEVKLVADKKEEEPQAVATATNPTVKPKLVVDKKEGEQQPATETATTPKKAKLLTVADQKDCGCQACPKKDKDPAGMTGNKDSQKPATAGEAAPKIALA